MPTTTRRNKVIAVIKSTMVFYFKSRCGEYTLYMGKDKYENEDLIKYGLDTDVWFHVDDLSSAHVYLRMKPSMKLDDINEALLLDCASLVKANSIVGCKVKLFRVAGLSKHFSRCKSHILLHLSHSPFLSHTSTQEIISLRSLHKMEEPEKDS